MVQGRVFSGERHRSSIYDGRQKERKSRRAFSPVPDPPLGMFRSQKGEQCLCQLSIFLKRDRAVFRLGLFTGFYLVGDGCFTLLNRGYGSFEVL